MQVFSLVKGIGKAALAALLFYMVFVFSTSCGEDIYQWIEKEHPSYLYRYATDGAFSENVYFSTQTQRLYGVPDSLPGIAAGESLSSLSGQLADGQWEIAGALQENEGYLQYLHGQGTSLSGLFIFCERISGLKDSVVYACRYLLFLLWVVALYLLMRCRPALYFSMGLLCIFATCVKLSGKFTAVFLLAPDASNRWMADGLLAPLVEAMLTFLIFDITIASLEKVRLDRKVKLLYMDLPALQWLIVRLAQETEQSGWYRSDISRLLPHFSEYLQTGKHTRKRAARLMEALQRLQAPHTNRTFLEAAVEIQTLLPSR